ncbi:jerky protein homolog-like [Diorhabda carinulata]|uniref:jerky protein homolog-like n=1 Tax=Diorhabda carinulata TaxID=1163345 RepID=UPI0025A28FA3|nr:jerky protein homolog-like [Diorhabda carinulata]
MRWLVVGKSKKPRAFKNINISAFTVYYQARKSAWMDCSLFQTWFFDKFVPAMEKYLKLKNLPIHVVLLLNNAPSHPSEFELQHGDIKAMFLSPHVTPLVPPMDQGVIDSFKRIYRRKYVSALLEKTEGGCDLFEAIKSLNIKVAIYLAAQDWEEVKKITLQKSWKKVYPGLSMTPETPDIPESDTLADVDVTSLTNEDIDDEQFIDPILQQASAEEESAEEEKEKGEKIRHSAAKDAFESALKYLEQQTTATAMMCAKK